MYYIIELLDNTDKTICQKAVKQNTLKEWSEQAILLAAKHGVESIRCKSVRCKSVRCNILCWTGCKYEHVQSFNFDQECVDRGVVCD